MAHRPPRLKRPAVMLVLALMGGMFAGAALPVSPWMALSAAAMLVALHFLSRSRRRAMLDSGALLWAAVVLVGMAQQSRLDLEDRLAARAVAALQREETVNARGRLAAPPRQRGASFVLDLVDCRLFSEDWDQSLTQPLGVRVFVSGPAARQWRDQPWPKVGALVEVRAATVARDSLANPGAFRYDRYLLREGVGVSLTCRRHAELLLSPPPQRRWWTQARARTLDAVGAVRRAMVDRIRSNMAPAQADLVEAVFLGHSHRLSQAQRETFIRVGVMHLFAVSGLHTGVIALFLFASLRLMRVPRRGAYVLACLLLLGYVTLMEFRPSTVRAALMYGCVCGPFFLKTRIEPLSALAFAAFVVLMVWPRSLFQLGFQLSFLCVLGMIILLPALEALFMLKEEDSHSGRTRDPQGLRRRWRRMRVNRWIIAPALTYVATLLAILPLQVNAFQYVSIVGVGVIVLLSAPVYVLLAITTLLATLGALGDPLAFGLGWAAGALAGAMEWLAREAAWAPGAAFTLPAVPFHLAGAYYLWLFCGEHLLAARSPVEAARRRAVMVLRLAGVGAFIAFLPLSRGPGGHMTMTFFDVGQGDACLIQWPDGRTLLVDGGDGRDDWGAGVNVLAPAMDYLGIERLNVVAASHFHADHIGGLPVVMRHRPPELVLYPPGETRLQVARRFLDAVTMYAAAQETMIAGDAFQGAGYRVVALWPTADMAQVADDNARSLVMRAEMGRFALLLTGDIDASIEMRMMRSGAPLEAQVLKVAHHGSATGTSSAFLHKARPLAAVISCGERNVHGHPALETLRRLEQVEARVYRTDQQGAVQMRTDGFRLWARTAGKGRSAMETMP